jgi:hypothetical protein
MSQRTHPDPAAPPCSARETGSARLHFYGARRLDRAARSRRGGSTIFVHTMPKHGRVGSLRDPGGAAFVMRGSVPAVI